MSGGHVHALHVHGHSPIHHLPPETKVAALLALVVAVVGTPREAIWAFAVYATLLAGVVVVAGLPVGFVLRRLAIETPFVLFAVFMPFLGGGPRTAVGPLSLSVEGLWGAWNILAKGTLGLAGSVLLVATTEVSDILRGLERLHTPRLLTAIAGFMVRYLEVVAGELSRMRTAMAARGYRPRWLGQTRALATSAGALFIRSYERGERVYQAMTARGYAGSMPVIEERSTPYRAWVTALSLPAAAWVVAITAWLVVG